MILFLVVLSTFSIGLSHASTCHSLQQSQLASLNERMNQMINALYPFSKAKSSGASYQSSTPVPPSDYSTVSPYDQPCYQYPPGYQAAPQGYQAPTQGYQPPVQGYQASSPQVVYMSQPQSSTVAISPPSPGNPPTVTISTTRSCYPQYEQGYTYEPKYPTQYYEYSYPQYQPPPPPYSAPQAPECTCQQEYHQPCPQPAPAPAQPEYQNCPPAPPCSPPPPYSTGPYQPPNYPPPPSSPYSPPYAPPTYPPTQTYSPPAQAYPPPPQSCPPLPQSYPPPPYTYGPPAYSQNAPQYAPAPTNPRDLIPMPQF